MAQGGPLDLGGSPWSWDQDFIGWPDNGGSPPWSWCPKWTCSSQVNNSFHRPKAMNTSILGIFYISLYNLNWGLLGRIPLVNHDLGVKTRRFGRYKLHRCYKTESHFFSNQTNRKTNTLRRSHGLLGTCTFHKNAKKVYYTWPDADNISVPLFLVTFTFTPTFGQDASHEP